MNLAMNQHSADFHAESMVRRFHLAIVTNRIDPLQVIGFRVTHEAQCGYNQSGLKPCDCPGVLALDMAGGGKTFLPNDNDVIAAPEGRN